MGLTVGDPPPRPIPALALGRTIAPASAAGLFCCGKTIVIGVRAVSAAVRCAGARGRRFRPPPAGPDSGLPSACHLAVCYTDPLHLAPAWRERACSLIGLVLVSERHPEGKNRWHR